MKKTLILLFAFLFLGGGAYWFIQKEKGPITTVKTDDRNFAVKETDQIGKIFIADRTGLENTLERKDGHWVCNNDFKIRNDAIGNLLETIQGLEIKFLPPKKGIPVIVKTLAAHGVKVEIYDLQGKIMRTYYVGGTTNDELATYMIMEGAEQPYAMHIPTMEGNLRLRYRIDGDDWRDRSVFSDKPNDIDFISIEYPKQKNKSFKIERKGIDYMVAPFYEVTPVISRKFRKGTDEKFMKEFTGLVAENFVNDNAERESISAMVPFAIITVRNKKGEETIAKFHPIRPLNAEGKPMSDSEVSTSTAVQRYHVDLSSGDFMLVQHRLFGKIFWSYESFFET